MGQNSMAVTLEIINMSRLELSSSYDSSKAKLTVHKNGLPQQILIFLSEQPGGSLYSLLHEALR